MIIMSMGLQLLPLLSNSPVSFAPHRIPPMLPFLLISLLIPSSFGEEAAVSKNGSFLYNGFHGANLSLNGVATIEPGGLLLLTNYTKQTIGHAFFPSPFNFVDSSTGKPLSFSTNFVFAIVPQYPDVGPQGLSFALSPSKELIGSHPSHYLGLFNLTNNGSPSNHIIAVELDTVQNVEYKDIDDNHVNLIVNNLQSIDSVPASYQFRNLSLASGNPTRLWVEYDGEKMRLDVTLAPVGAAKPSVPLLSSVLNLSSFVVDEMYVGFSASTGVTTGLNCVLGWSFGLNGEAKELDISKLPSLPPTGEVGKHRPRRPALLIALSIAMAVLLFVAVAIVVVVLRKRKYSEVRADWEVEYGPHRIPYDELYKATKGFRDENVLGAGGYGSVYKGSIPKSKLEIAVKRISNESRQGMKEFVSEIVSIGRVRHRNLVRLLGYNRRKGELLLVYEFVPNGSLDKYLFDRPGEVLSWSRRFRIVKGIAAGLLYLHEEWEQVILHRDIKAGNVLLDEEYNSKLGDFGLARLYDHESSPETTRVVGSLGYLAPELSRTGIATTGSDVYAFGAFLLEVACGRRPIEVRSSGIGLVLVDWVLDLWKRGVVVEARDRRLGMEFVAEELELVLKVGLACSHPDPVARPSMRQVVQFLDGDLEVPEMSEVDMCRFDSARYKNSTACDPQVATSL